MGLFDAMEESFDEYEEYKGGLPEGGPYACIVAAAETEQKESGLYLVLTYTVTEGKYTGMSHKEFQRIVVGRAQNENDEKAIRFLKTRLLSLGIEGNLNSVEPDDITGREVALTMRPQKNNPQYMQIARVDLLNAAASSPALPSTAAPKPPSAGSDMFA